MRLYSHHVHLFFFLARLVFYLKRRALLWPALPAIIESGSCNAGMPKPLLYLGNVSVVCQGIGGGCGTQRMHAEAVYIGIDADHGTVVLHDPLVHRIRMQVLCQ